LCYDLWGECYFTIFKALQYRICNLSLSVKASKSTDFIVVIIQITTCTVHVIHIIYKIWRSGISPHCPFRTTHHLGGGPQNTSRFGRSIDPRTRVPPGNSTHIGGKPLHFTFGGQDTMGPTFWNNLSKLHVEQHSV